MPDLSTLRINVDAESGIRNLDRYDVAASRANKSSQLLDSAIGKLTAAFGAAVVIKKFVDETSAAQKAQAQLEAAVRSTGGAAGRTVAQLQALASELQGVSTASDDAVQGAQAVLLTFTKISGANFDAATRAVVDLAERMGGDLTGAALQVGKALNDPEAGLTALTRSGVSFNAVQKETIKLLAETGGVAEAQRIILEELTKEFGGSAAAARDTLGGALTGLKNDFGDLFEVSRAKSGQTIAAINNLAGAIRGVNDAFSKSDAFPIFVRELGNMVNGAVNAARAFGEVGTQIDLTGEKIRGLTELLDAASRFDSAGIESGLERIRRGNEGIADSMERIRNLRELSYLKEQESRQAKPTGQGQDYLAQLRGAGVPTTGLQPGGAFSIFGTTALADGKALSAQIQTVTDDVGSLNDAYAKAVTTALNARDRQSALNAAFGETESAIAELNAQLALKEKFAQIDANFTGKQAASLKALASALADLEAQARRNAEAQKQFNDLEAKERAASEATVRLSADKLAALNATTTAQSAATIALKENIDAQRRQQNGDANATLEAQRKELDLIGKTVEQRKQLIDMERYFGAIKKGYSDRQADEYVRNQRAIDDSKTQTQSWADNLQQVVGIVQLIASAFGDVGREIAQAATGAQSIIGGLKAADALKNAKGDKIGLGAALSGSGGIGAQLGALSVAGQIAGGALAIADAVDLFGNRARERARKMQQDAEVYNQALDSFAIVDRTSLQESIRANDAKLTNLAKQAAAAGGGTFNGSIKDAEGLDRLIAQLQGAADSSKLLARGLNPVITQMQALAQITRDNEVALKARNAAEVATLSQDLEVRSLRARGLTAEADALSASNAAKREQDEINKKYEDTVLNAALAQVQLEEATRRTADAAREAAEKAEQERRSIFDLVNGARGFTDPRGANQAAFEEAQRRRFDDASSAAEELAVSLFNTAEAIDRAMQIIESDTRTRESLTARGLSALGNTRGAEDATLGASQRQELVDAIRDSMSDTNYALLQFVQFAERERVAMQRAIEDGTAAIKAAAAAQIAAIDTQIDVQRQLSQASQAAFDAQIEAVRGASDAQLADLDAQSEVLRGILDVARDQLQAAESALQISERAYDALNAFGRSFLLGNSSTLSPTQRLAEARAQFEAIERQARGGNGGAAAGLPAAAQALLDASRMVNASGTGYVTDAMRVQTTVAELTARFGAQLNSQQQTVASLQSLVASTETQLAALDTLREVIKTASDAQIGILQAAKDADKAASDTIIEKLQGSKAAIEAGVQRQIDALVKLETEAFQTRIQASAYYAEWQRLTTEQAEAAAEYYRKADAFFAGGGVVERVNIDPVPVVSAPNDESTQQLKTVVTELKNVVAGQAEQIATLKQQLKLMADAAIANGLKLDAISTKLDEGNRITRLGAEGRMVS